MIDDLLRGRARPVAERDRDVAVKRERDQLLRGGDLRDRLVRKTDEQRRKRINGKRERRQARMSQGAEHGRWNTERRRTVK